MCSCIRYKMLAGFHDFNGISDVDHEAGFCGDGEHPETAREWHSFVDTSVFLQQPKRFFDLKGAKRFLSIKIRPNNGSACQEQTITPVIGSIFGI